MGNEIEIPYSAAIKLLKIGYILREIEGLEELKDIKKLLYELKQFIGFKFWENIINLNYSIEEIKKNPQEIELRSNS